MGRPRTEMLKGVLEGVVLAVLAIAPAYGYEITAQLRRRGFDGIAEGTVYALLVRIERRGLVVVERRPSEKGPPRKVYSLSAAGRRSLDEFWGNWSFLSQQLEGLRGGGRDVTAETGDVPPADPGGDAA
ncbi:MAG: PadR family transcriptional regulator [Pseudoclavibacter sp.]